MAGAGFWHSVMGSLSDLDSGCIAVIFSLPLVWELQANEQEVVVVLYLVDG